MALLTPALTYGYPDPEYINFYYGHGLILIGVGMPVFVLKERPQFADFIFVVKVTLAMTAIIFILNHLLGEGANFWYLKDKPNGDTIINLFPSAPFHILGLIPAAIFRFLFDIFALPVERQDFWFMIRYRAFLLKSESHFHLHNTNSRFDGNTIDVYL